MELHVRCLPLARPARPPAQAGKGEVRSAPGVGIGTRTHGRVNCRGLEAWTLEAGHGSTTSSPRLVSAFEERANVGRSELRTSWGRGNPG